MAANERLFGYGMLVAVFWACLFGGGDFTSGLSETENSSKNQGTCQIYNGKTCQKALNSTDRRYINKTLGFNKTESFAAKLVERLEQIIKPHSSNKMCARIIRLILCFYVFPPCSEDGEKIEYCREDCTYVFKICGAQLNQLRGAGVVIIFNTSFESIFRFDDCKTYPSVKDNPRRKNKCSHLPNIDIPPPAAEPAGMSKVLVIVLSVVGLLMCMSILAIFRCRLAASKKRTQSLRYEEDLDTTDGLSNVVTMRDRIREWKVAPSELTELVDICKSRGVHEIVVDDIEYLKDLGSGQYGLVFQGKLPEVIEGESVVAVKTLREGSSEEAIKEFCQEVNIMSTFSHPNVVRLLAVALAGEPYCMIFEFVEFGDLSSFLRSCVEAEEEGSSGYPKLTVADQLSMALQVANGMKYISSIRCVHRDLAARNCLVGRELFIKISDFGLSRDVYTSEYYVMDKTRMLPVRWLPPEAFVDGKFTTYSDIYSYGVLMWEIFTFAKLPYEEYDNEKAMALILEGQILEKPDECPDPVYDIMKRCWVTIPKERIPFPEIIDELCSLDNYGGRFTVEDDDDVVENYHGRIPPRVSFKKGFNNLAYTYSLADLEGPPINVVHDTRKNPANYNSLPVLQTRKASGEEQSVGNGIAYDGVVTLSEAGGKNKSLPGKSSGDIVGPQAIHRMTPPQDEMQGYHNRSNETHLENQRNTSRSPLISEDHEEPGETNDERRQMSHSSELDVGNEGLGDTYDVPPEAQRGGHGDDGESQETYDIPPSSHGTPVSKRSPKRSSEQSQISQNSNDDEQPEDTYVVPPIPQRGRHGDYGEPEETYKNKTEYGETYDVPPTSHVPAVSLRPPQLQDTYDIPPSPSQKRLRQISRDGEGPHETYDVPPRHEENASDELYQNAGNLGTDIYCVPKSPFLERRNQNNGAPAGQNQSTLTSTLQKRPYENVGFDGKPVIL